MTDIHAGHIRKPMSFDDPKPEVEKRKMQTIYLRPSLRDCIDARRGKLSRSEWIEIAVLRSLIGAQP